MRIVQWMVLTLSLCCTVAFAEPGNDLTQKAKIIRNIIQKITWPNHPNEIRICLMGDFSDTSAMKALNNTSIDKKKIRVSQTPDIKDAKDCQLIYIADSEAARAKQIIDAFEGKPVLLVGDFDDFAQNGGSINFLMLNHVRAITLNLESIKKSKLVIDLKEYEAVTIFPEEKDLPK